MEWHSPFTASPEAYLKLHQAQLERRMQRIALLNQISGQGSDRPQNAQFRRLISRVIAIVHQLQQDNAPLYLPREAKLATSTGEIQAVK